MMLFELLLIPLVTIMCTALWSRGKGNIVFPLSSFIIGAIVFFPGIFLFYLFRGLFPMDYSSIDLYLYFMGQDHLLHLIFSTAGLLLIRAFIQKTVNDNYTFRALAFYGGYYTLVSCFYFLENLSHLNEYVLFVLPLLHLSTVLLASIAVSQFHTRDGVSRIIPLVMLVVPAALFGFISTGPLQNNFILSVIAAVVVTGVSGFGFWKLKDY